MSVQKGFAGRRTVFHRCGGVLFASLFRREGLGQGRRFRGAFRNLAFTQGKKSGGEQVASCLKLEPQRDTGASQAATGQSSHACPRPQ